MDRILSLPVTGGLSVRITARAVLHFLAVISARYAQRQALLQMDDARLQDMGILRDQI